MNLILLFPLSLLGYGIYSADFPYKIVCALFSLPFLSVVMLVNGFWSRLFLETTYLNINSKSINIYNKTFEKTKASLAIQVEELEKLKLVAHCIAPGDPRSQYSELIKIPPKLILEAREKEYNLDQYATTIFTKSELYLIADEICKQLNINPVWQIVEIKDY